MSQWDPNDPNNPYNQQWQGQQGQQGQQQWGQQEQPQQQWQQPQQQWDQQQAWDQQQQQQQYDPNQYQQQQYDPNQYQQQQWQQQPPQQQQWDQQQQYGQQQQQYGQQQYGQDPNQGYGQQQQQQQQQGGFGFGGGGGFGFGGGQQPGYGQAAYQGAYNETFGNASDAVPGTIATLGVNERVQFLRRTYAHLAGAIVVFCGLLFALLHPSSPLFESVSLKLTEFAIMGPRWHWLVVLAAFAGVSFVADQWAQRAGSKPMQYLGLGVYVLAEALIFVPLLMIVLYLAKVSNPGEILAISGIVTLALFGGLTAVVFITKKDFSFLRGILGIGTMAALAIIVCGVIFGFNLGLFFAGAMLLLASGYVLFYTSRVMKYYHPDQYVAASLALFACIALILWYVIQIVMELAGE